MLNVFLCDDNTVLLEKYSETVRRISERHGIAVHISTVTDGDKLLFSLGDDVNAADIIFLDVLLGRINGVDTARTLRERGCKAEIIFLTSSEEFVFESFYATPLHYLLKTDVTEEKLEDIYMRAVKLASQKSKEFFSYRVDKEIHRVLLSEIACFEVQNRIIVIHGAEQDYSYYSSMEKLQAELNSSRFVRVHRAYIVNLQYIEKISKSTITLLDGRIVPIGATYLADLKRVFSAYLSQSMSEA